MLRRGLAAEAGPAVPREDRGTVASEFVGRSAAGNPAARLAQPSRYLLYEVYSRDAGPMRWGATQRLGTRDGAVLQGCRA